MTVNETAIILMAFVGSGFLGFINAAYGNPLALPLISGRQK
ncbi:MAG: hypothetical protein ACK4NR_12170 [Micavibrio sp.]